MAKTQKPIKRSDGHTQRYTVGTDHVVPLAGSAVPSAHATSTANTSFDASAVESTDYRSHVTLPSAESIPDSNAALSVEALSGGRYQTEDYAGFELNMETGRVHHFAVPAHYQFSSDDESTTANFLFANPLPSEVKAEALASVASDLGRLTYAGRANWAKDRECSGDHRGNCLAVGCEEVSDYFRDISDQIQAVFDDQEAEGWANNQVEAQNEADFQLTGELQQARAKELSTPDFIVMVDDCHDGETREVTVVNAGGDDLLGGETCMIDARAERLDELEETVAHAKALAADAEWDRLYAIQEAEEAAQLASLR